MRQSNPAGSLGVALLAAFGFVALSCRRPEPTRRQPPPGESTPPLTPGLPSGEPSIGRDAKAATGTRAAATAAEGASSTRALLGACAEGFVPSATAKIDVVRLGLLCGPSGGLVQFARTAGSVDEAEGPAEYGWDAERGDCFRLFAVADQPVDDLEVEIRGPEDGRVLLANQNRRWVVAPSDEVFCAPRAGSFQALFRTHGGRGGYAATVWRGRRMRAAR